MRGPLKLILIIVAIPWVLVGVYLAAPEAFALLGSFFEDPVIRYVDKGGKVHFVSNLESVPEQYREKAEVNPALKNIMKTDFQPYPTVIPKPAVQRGGDGVINYEAEMSQASDELTRCQSNCSGDGHFNGKGAECSNTCQRNYAQRTRNMQNRPRPQRAPDNLGGADAGGEVSRFQQVLQSLLGGGRP
jgi:hypothetical protein